MPGYAPPVRLQALAGFQWSWLLHPVPFYLWDAYATVRLSSGATEVDLGVAGIALVVAPFLVGIAHVHRHVGDRTAARADARRRAMFLAVLFGSLGLLYVLTVTVRALGAALAALWGVLPVVEFPGSPHQFLPFPKPVAGLLPAVLVALYVSYGRRAAWPGRLGERVERFVVD